MVCLYLLLVLFMFILWFVCSFLLYYSRLYYDLSVASCCIASYQLMVILLSEKTVPKHKTNAVGSSLICEKITECETPTGSGNL